jgi:acetolactate synthase I/II/III large subunit
VNGRPTVTGGELVVDTLRVLGVERVFGVPGGQTLAIMDAFLDEPAVTFTAARHEGAAACMADTVGRLSRRVGVCLATTGPGATNLLTGVGGALRDSSPVLALTCNNRLSEFGRDDTQSADHVAIFRPLTKWATLVTSPLDIPRVLREAAARATSGCPGPVLVDFARDALEAAVPRAEAEAAGYGAEPAAPHAEGHAAVPGQRLPAETVRVETAVSWILEAHRPVLWIGNGVQLSGAQAIALELAEQLDVPVLTTFNALGSAPTDHPNVFGTLSRMGTVLGHQVMDGSDLLIAIGNSLNAVSTSRWQAPLPERIVQIDIDPATLGVNYPERTLGLLGDAQAVIVQLRAAIDASSHVAEHASSRAGRLRELGELKRQWWSKVEAADMEGAPMSPLALMKALRESVPGDAALVVDAGNPGVWSHLWRVPRAGRYLKPVGFGNMGFGIPAAIAARFVDDARPVVAIVGDGSLGMTMGELETVVRERLAICIVVMNDLGYGNIRHEEVLKYGERVIGVDFVDVDYVAVAKGFGIAAQRADRGTELAAAVRTVLASGVAGLIDARIDPRENAWTHPLLAEASAVGETR